MAGINAAFLDSSICVSHPARVERKVAPTSHALSQSDRFIEAVSQALNTPDVLPALRMQRSYREHVELRGRTWSMRVLSKFSILSAKSTIHGRGCGPGPGWIVLIVAFRSSTLRRAF